MKVVVGGASGFLGTALVGHLRDAGHEVVRLIRREDGSADASRWDPAAGSVDQSLIDSADAVVNLSGAPIAHWPPTQRWRRELVSSRLGPTTTLASAISRAPRPPVFLSGSACGIYGTDRGTEALTEAKAPGPGFLAQLAIDWEAAASPAAESGSRVVLLRTGLPLHRSGGALKPMLPAFRLGLGAKLGSGTQFFPAVSLVDWCRAVEHALGHDVSGPLNIGMPDVPTNAEFTDALARAVHRPSFMRAPGAPIRLALGELGESLLGSIRLVPQQLIDSGFEFAHPTLPDVLRAGLA